MQSFYVLVAHFKTTWRIWLKCRLLACVEETKMFQYEFYKELFFFTSSHSEAFSFANLGFSMNFFKLIKLGILWSWRKHESYLAWGQCLLKKTVFFTGFMNAVETRFLYVITAFGLSNKSWVNYVFCLEYFFNSSKML